MYFLVMSYNLQVVGPENGKWKPGSAQRKKLEEAEKAELAKNPNKVYPLILHTKKVQDKADTEVLRASTEVNHLL
jgi:hypothetical protein